MNRTVHPEVGRARALIAVRTRELARGHVPPEAIEDARRELLNARAIERAELIAADWPAISQATRDRIASVIPAQAVQA